ISQVDSYPTNVISLVDSVGDAATVIGSASNATTTLCSSFPTAIDEKNTSENFISIFPSPAKNQLTISFEKGALHEIIIYDLLEKKCLFKFLEHKEQTVTMDVS